MIIFILYLVISGGFMFFINSHRPELEERLKSEGLDPDGFDVLMVAAGLLWPLAFGMALARGLFKND